MSGQQSNSAEARDLAHHLLDTLVVLVQGHDVVAKLIQGPGNL